MIIRTYMNDFPVRGILNLMNTVVEDPLVSSLLDGDEAVGGTSRIKIPAPGVSKDDVKVKKSADHIYLYVRDKVFRTIPIKASIPADSISVKVSNGVIVVDVDSTGSLEDIEVK